MRRLRSAPRDLSSSTGSCITRTFRPGRVWRVGKSYASLFLRRFLSPASSRANTVRFTAGDWLMWCGGRQVSVNSVAQAVRKGSAPACFAAPGTNTTDSTANQQKCMSSQFRQLASPRSRWPQGWFLRRAVFLACTWPPSCRVLTRPFLCVRPWREGDGGRVSSGASFLGGYRSY